MPFFQFVFLKETHVAFFYYTAFVFVLFLIPYTTIYLPLQRLQLALTHRTLHFIAITSPLNVFLGIFLCVSIISNVRVCTLCVFYLQNFGFSARHARHRSLVEYNNGNLSSRRRQFITDLLRFALVEFVLPRQVLLLL